MNILIFRGYYSILRLFHTFVDDETGKEILKRLQFLINLSSYATQVRESYTYTLEYTFFSESLTFKFKIIAYYVKYVIINKA